jgi:hypothetical protein
LGAGGVGGAGLDRGGIDGERHRDGPACGWSGELFGRLVAGYRGTEEQREVAGLFQRPTAKPVADRPPLSGGVGVRLAVAGRGERVGK